MAEVLEINGKIFRAIKDAAVAVSYSRDYVTRLAREKKIVAMYVGRQWFVDIDSLKNYTEVMGLEQRLRQQHLSEERKKQLNLKNLREQRATKRFARVSVMNASAVALTGIVLLSGTVTGLASYQLWSSIQPVGVQVATSYDTLRSDEALPTASVLALQDQSSVETSVSNITDDETVSDIRPTSTINSLGSISTGVLLLPDHGTTTTVTELFSDPVVVKKKTDGSLVVNQVDVSGEPVGNEIPLVLVPVKRENL